MLVSGVQQRDSVIHIKYILFFIIGYYKISNIVPVLCSRTLLYFAYSSLYLLIP